MTWSVDEQKHQYERDQVPSFYDEDYAGESSPTPPGLGRWFTDRCKSWIYGTPVPQRASQRAYNEKYRQLSAQRRSMKENDCEYDAKGYNERSQSDGVFEAKYNESTMDLDTMYEATGTNKQLVTPLQPSKVENTLKKHSGILKAHNGSSASRDATENNTGTKTVQFAKGFTPDTLSEEFLEPSQMNHDTSMNRRKLEFDANCSPVQSPLLNPVDTDQSMSVDAVGDHLVETFEALNNTLGSFAPDIFAQQQIAELSEQLDNALAYASQKDREASEAEMKSNKIMEEFTLIGENYEREIKKLTAQIKQQDSELSLVRMNEARLKTDNQRLQKEAEGFPRHLDELDKQKTQNLQLKTELAEAKSAEHGLRQKLSVLIREKVGLEEQIRQLTVKSHNDASFSSRDLPKMQQLGVKLRPQLSETQLDNHGLNDNPNRVHPEYGVVGNDVELDLPERFSRQSSLSPRNWHLVSEVSPSRSFDSVTESVQSSPHRAASLSDRKTPPVGYMYDRDLPRSSDESSDVVGLDSDRRRTSRMRIAQRLREKKNLINN